MGVRFRKQHPIDPYVVDFYAPAAKLVIEIDGAAHDRGDRPERDQARDEFLAARGYRVVRIGARGVLEDADAAVEAVIALALNPLHHPSDGLPPRAGEDL